MFHVKHYKCDKTCSLTINIKNNLLDYFLNLFFEVDKSSSFYQLYNICCFKI